MSSKFKKLGAFGTTVLFYAIASGSVFAGKDKKEKPVEISQVLRAKRNEKKRARDPLSAKKKIFMIPIKKDFEDVHYSLGTVDGVFTLFISGKGIVKENDIYELLNNNSSSFHKIKAVNVLSSEIEIGERAFSEVLGLERVEGNMKSIGDSAFLGCEDLSDVKFSDNLESIGNNAFENCEKLKTIIIPEKVSKIGEYAFLNCSKLEEVTFLSEKIEIIRMGVFQNTGLKKITIPDGVEMINDNAFDDCTSLEKVILPETCLHLCFNSFARCEKLKEINLEYVKKLDDDGVFYGCTSLNKDAKSFIDNLGGDDFGPEKESEEKK